jgi:phosphoribulokinase
LKAKFVKKGKKKGKKIDFKKAKSNETEMMKRANLKEFNKEGKGKHDVATEPEVVKLSKIKLPGASE